MSVSSGRFCAVFRSWMNERAILYRKMEELMSEPYCLDLPGEVEMKPGEFVWQPAYGKWKYLYNVANYASVDFYRIHGLSPVSQAFELGVTRPMVWDVKNEEEYQVAVKADLMQI